MYVLEPQLRPTESESQGPRIHFFIISWYKESVCDSDAHLKFWESPVSIRWFLSTSSALPYSPPQASAWFSLVISSFVHFLILQLLCAICAYRNKVLMNKISKILTTWSLYSNDNARNMQVTNTTKIILDYGKHYLRINTF